MQLGIKDPDPSPLKMLKQLYERLLQIEKEGRKAVVLIDEAQMLHSKELMEEFRGLLNLEIPDKKLLNIVFFGLPELDSVLQLDAPLAQRVAVKYTLKPLSADATGSYVQHRLKIAGCQNSPFAPATQPLIHKFSGGVPRLINAICDNALFETYLRRDPQVTEQIIRNVVEDLGLLKLQKARKKEEPIDHDEIEMIFDELEGK